MLSVGSPFEPAQVGEKLLSIWPSIFSDGRPQNFNLLYTACFVFLFTSTSDKLRQRYSSNDDTKQVPHQKTILLREETSFGSIPPLANP